MLNLGQVAYEAYRETSHGKSLYSGKAIPEWERLDPNIQAAWEAAARAVLEAADEEL